MALFDPVSVFRGWPEDAAARDAEYERLLSAVHNRLAEMGVQPGVRIVFRYRGRVLSGTVIRVNRYTDSVGADGSSRVRLRVPLVRVLNTVPS